MTSINPFSKPVFQSDNKIGENKPNSVSSADTTNEPNPKRQKYIFENDGKSYEINLILMEDKIKIKVDLLPEGKEEYFYERDISQEELKKTNRVFRLFDYIEESFDYFSNLFNDEQNKFSVKEENCVFSIEKKIRLFFPLKIEIPKKNIKNELDKNIQIKDLINNQNINKNEIIQDNKEKSENNKNEEENEKENITQLNITNEELLKENSKNKLHNYLYINKEEKDIIELTEELEEGQKEIEDNNSKKNLLNIEKFKSVPNLSEDKSKNKSALLQKKRTNNSDLSDISFNSISNENDYFNNSNINNPKKQKSNLAKETFYKIFSDNASVNSGESGKNFFLKVQHNLNLEKNKKKDLNNVNLNKDIDNVEFNPNNKKNNEEIILFGDEDSSEYIKDDLDLFSNKSNKSPTITPIGGKINNTNELNENNFKLHNMYNNNNPDSFKKYDDSTMAKNYNKCIATIQKIQIKEGCKDINNSYNNNYNLKNNYYNNFDNKMQMDFANNTYDLNNQIKEVNSYNKFNKYNKSEKSYRIIHKNYIEYCNTEMSYLFGEEMPNNITFSLESNIISNSSEFDFIINYLKKKFNKEIKNAIHIYQATEDGPTAEDFHRICDGNTNIIVLIKAKDGKIFGGYTSIGFNSFNRSYLDDTAFIFSIDKREIYPNIHGKNAVDSFYNLGPCFSGDTIKIFDNFLMKEGITAKMSANYEMNEEYQINFGKRTFEVEEIEVLEFIEMKNDDDNI